LLAAVPSSLLVPIVAISLSAILLGEKISLQMMVAAGVLCAGLFIIARARN
jgi:drug/metabolite transporter (DMT)-like permease